MTYPFDLKTGKCHCLRCSNDWKSDKIFIEGVPPVQCPRCKSTQWMLPRLRKSRRKS